MQEKSDMEWLQEYVHRRSDEAFAALVTRHVSMVYSAAFRKTGSSHAAEEVTQAVFIILAKKAGTLRSGTILSGWLYQATRLTSASYLRNETRRVGREQEAYMQSLTDKPEETVWQEIEPWLEDAMGALGEKDRNALVLRFFEGKSFQEIAVAVGTSENASKKRVAHALEKLRRFFARRGVGSTTAILAGLMSAHSVQAAPVALTKSIAGAAIAHGVAASGSTSILIKGTLELMAWTKVKSAVVAGVCLILAAGTTTLVFKKYGQVSPAKLEWTSAERQKFQAESTKRIHEAKGTVMDCFVFAEANQNRWPTNLAQLKATYPQDRPADVTKSPLSDSNWEFVSGGAKDDRPDSANTILFRERQPRQSPDGKFVKVYAFSDGSVHLLTSPDENFSEMEKRRGLVVQRPLNP